MLPRLVSPSGSASGQQPSGHAAATEPLRATHPSASADALSSPAWPAATHPPAGVQSLAGDWPRPFLAGETFMTPNPFIRGYRDLHQVRMKGLGVMNVSSRSEEHTSELQSSESSV